MLYTNMASSRWAETEHPEAKKAEMEAQGEPMVVEQKKSRRKRKRAKKDPDAPKKPLNAWFTFLAEWRQQHKDKYPNLSVTELVKKARLDYKPSKPQ